MAGTFIRRSIPPRFVASLRSLASHAQSQSYKSDLQGSVSSASDVPLEDAKVVAANGGKHAWRNFKIMLFLSTTAASAGIAYATYAYSIEDIHDKISALRSSTSKKSIEDNLTHRVQEALYSTSIHDPQILLLISLWPPFHTSRPQEEGRLEIFLESIIPSEVAWARRKQQWQ